MSPLMLNPFSCACAARGTPTSVTTRQMNPAISVVFRMTIAVFPCYVWCEPCCNGFCREVCEPPGEEFRVRTET